MFNTLSTSFKKKKSKRGWFLRKPRTSVPQKRVSTDIKPTQKHINTLVSRAKNEAQQIVLKARSEALDLKSSSDDRDRRNQQLLFDKQTQLDKQKSLLAQNQARIQARENYLSHQEKLLAETQANIDKLYQTYLDKVSQVADLDDQTATNELLKNIHKKLDRDHSRWLQEKEDAIQDDSSSLMQHVLVTAMSRGGIDYSHEYKSPVIQVTSKRILQEIRGTNDCNKEFLEKLADVELIIDDENVIKINSIDSVNREIARQTLERLIKNGRINPARIRRVYQQISRDLHRIMLQAGKDLCHAVGVYNLPEDIMQKLGKFKFRFSYGQNMIEHTLEETLIGISLAHEFGVDSNIVRLGCLFHDIGKVIYDDEGTHVETGVEYLKKQGIPPAVIDCVAQSHEDEPFSSVESMIVHIADGISGARPAARHNDHEFANRVKYLEETPLTYSGVKEAFAIQAGREVRVIVDPNKLSDEDIPTLAQKLKDQIKAELTYPGSVTINVIREVAATSTITNTQEKTQ